MFLEGVDGAVGDMEKTGGRGRAEKIREVLAVGIGDENLTETVAVNQADNALDTLAIQLIENIVQQQNGFAQIERLRQLHGEQKGLLLPLRTHLLERVGVQLHGEVVLVDALTRPTQNKVTGTGADKSLLQIAVLQLARIAKRHRLAAARYLAIKRLEKRKEGVDEGLPGVIYIMCGGKHLQLQHLEEFPRHCFGIGVLLEQSVALFEQGVVGGEMLQIGAIFLRDDDIHETASLIAAVFDQCAVLRADHDKRQKTDMVGEALVVGLAQPKLLLLTTLEPAGDPERLRLGGIQTLHHRHRLGVGDVERIDGVVGRFGETEQVNAVEDVGFALSVEPDKAIQFIRKVQLRLTDILVIQYGKFL